MVFNSGSSLDFHCLLKAISKRKYARLSCIARTSENYISFSWRARLKCGGTIEFRFLDSYRFLSRSLASIVDSMDAFPNFMEYFEKNHPGVTADKDLLAKPPMCYEYLDCLEVLEDKEFPTREKFYSSLTDESVSEDVWARGKELYQKLNCKSLFDYLNFYLATDILFLSDACEQFRDIGMKHYSLDPFYYYTLAGFAFDSCLLFTKMKLPLMQDVNQVLFVNKGMKGGLCFGNQMLANSNSTY